MVATSRSQLLSSKFAQHEGKLVVQLPRQRPGESHFCFSWAANGHPEYSTQVEQARLSQRDQRALDARLCDLRGSPRHSSASSSRFELKAMGNHGKRERADPGGITPAQLVLSTPPRRNATRPDGATLSPA